MVSECGLHPGDRVMVILPRIPQWWLINLAAMRIGKLYLLSEYESKNGIDHSRIVDLLQVFDISGLAQVVLRGKVARTSGLY